MTWKDYALITLVQALVILGGAYWIEKQYPPMARYADAVGRSIGAEASKALQAFDERLKALEAATGATKGGRTP
jgi:ABC-type Fe3+-hydroxamate transport system substrate-binding protein